MIERALVTGATGFIGSHVARLLLAEGVEVHALARENARLDRVPDLVDRVTFHLDHGTAESSAALVDVVRPEATFHLATHFVAEHTLADVDALVDANIGVPTRLVDALAGTPEPSVFVNAGTAWQHVGGATYRPKNLYAATKQAFEDVLAYPTRAGKLRAVTLNIFDTYGPHDYRGKLLSVLMDALTTGEALAMSSGEQLLDYVHVDDVAAAFVRASDPTSLGDVGRGDAGVGTGAVFALSSGAPRRVRDVVDLLGEIAGRPVPVTWGARPDRADEMLTPWAAGPPLPGWSPGTDLRDGLSRLVHSRSAG